MRSTVFQALSHPVRREILALLKGGPLASGKLAEPFKLAWPTISRHLAVLKAADLITAEKSGTSVVYRVNTSVLEEAAALLFSLVQAKPASNKLSTRSARGVRR
jgi:DNA-binding transcriptional ArsR family regulator